MSLANPIVILFSEVAIEQDITFLFKSSSATNMFEKKDGSKTTVDLEKLSAADQEYVKQQRLKAEQAKPKPGKPKP